MSGDVANPLCVLMSKECFIVSDLCHEFNTSVMYPDVLMLYATACVFAHLVRNILTDYPTGLCES